MNNLEYDHADIYPDLAAIERQFQHLLRTVPGGGRIVCNGADAEPGARAGSGLLDAGREICARRCPGGGGRCGRRRCSQAGLDRGRARGCRFLALRGAARGPQLRQRALELDRRTQRRKRAGSAGCGAPRRSADRARHRVLEPLSTALRGACSCAARPQASRSTTTSRTIPTAIRTTIDGLRRQVGQRTHRRGTRAALEHHATGGAPADTGPVARGRG